MYRTQLTIFTLVFASLTLAGCSSMKDVPGVGGIITKMTPRDPSVVAREMFDVYDADKRRRSINEISNADWGGQEEYLAAYRLLINDEDPTVRSAAIHALGVHGSGSDAPAIIPYLKSKASFVRWEAAAALQRLQHASAIEPLITTLRTDDDGDVRQAAANALGQYPDRRVFEALLGTLNEQDYSVVQQSAESLATITGQDFGDDGSAWLKWSRESTSMFTNAQAYYYPQFDRPRTMMEKMQFWKPKPGPIQPQTPRGAVASSAASQISNKLPAPALHKTTTSPQPVKKATAPVKSMPKTTQAPPLPVRPVPAPAATTPPAAYAPPIQTLESPESPEAAPTPATTAPGVPIGPYRGDRSLSRPRSSNLGAKDNQAPTTAPQK